MFNSNDHAWTICDYLIYSYGKDRKDSIHKMPCPEFSTMNVVGSGVYWHRVLALSAGPWPFFQEHHDMGKEELNKNLKPLASLNHLDRCFTTASSLYTGIPLQDCHSS